LHISTSVLNPDISRSSKHQEVLDQRCLMKLKRKLQDYMRLSLLDRANIYAEFISNIVPVFKKNRKLLVCINFRDFTKLHQWMDIQLVIDDLLVDVASGHKVIIFIDGNTRYNQIFMAEEDIAKTALIYPGAIGLHEWIIMTFGAKNVGAIY
jgi:hypothetical protein